MYLKGENECLHKQKTDWCGSTSLSRRLAGRIRREYHHQWRPPRSRASPPPLERVPFPHAPDQLTPAYHPAPLTMVHDVRKGVYSTHVLPQFPNHTLLSCGRPPRFCAGVPHHAQLQAHVPDPVPALRRWFDPAIPGTWMSPVELAIANEPIINIVEDVIRLCLPSPHV